MRHILPAFVAIALTSGLSAGPARAQDSDAPPPRGSVAADCYTRIELWQGDVRSPVRLLFTRVMYNETASGGLARELSSQWNKFIGARLASEPAQPGQNRIVYCRYADAPNNTEIARWPASSAPPEEVNWPGRSVAWQAVAPVAAAPVPPAAPMQALVAPPVAVAVSAPNPGAAAFTPPAAPPVAASGAIDGDLAGLPAAPEGMKYDSAAVEAYQQQMEAYRQKLASDQAAQAARAEVLRQQQEAYQRELAAAQEARRKYEAERAAYEAELAKLKK
jgi:hypothetical protein